MRTLILLIILNTLLIPAFANKSDNQGPPPPVVEVASVKSQPWQQQIQATGSLAALQGIMVKPEISGRVTKIYFQSGQNVKQGQPLISLDEEILRAQLQSKQAALVLQQNNFSRSIKLFKDHAIAKADYDTTKSNLMTAEAEVNQAKAELNEAVITAPFSGRLGLRQVSLGDYVAPGQNIINLQSLDPIVVNFSVPELYLSEIALGDTVSIRTDAYPNQIFSGKVYAMDSVVDPNTRTLAVRAKIPNADEKLLPGSFVEVTLKLGQSKNVLTIPTTALVSSLEGNYVYKVVNNLAVKTPVTVASRGNEMAIISNGLKAGDTIIATGQLKITQDKTPVIIANTHSTKTS